MVTTPPARSTVSVSLVSVAMLGTILSGVGYNPYRKFKAKPSDYVLVAVAIVIAIALVAWAFLG